MIAPDRVRLVLVQSAAAETFGAAERALWELATRLPESRYDVSAWLSEERSHDDLADSLAERGVPVTRLSGPSSRWDLRRSWRVWKALRRARPDLLHFHLGAEPPARRLPAVARLAGAPVTIVSQHGTPEPWPWGDLRQAEAVTVPCAAVRDALARDQDLPRDRVRVVPSGADPPDEVSELPAARRLREQFGAGAYRPLWVCAGRLESSKGQDVLLDALARLRTEGLDFVTVMAGEGSLREALERSVQDLGLARQVRFVGAVDSLGPLLLAADAVVLPSREDAVPRSMLDAMARSRPVVVSRVGGMPEVVEDGEQGLTVPAKDAPALARALQELHEKPDRARRMGVLARDRVLEGYTWDRVMERYESVYDEVLGLANFVAGGRQRGKAARDRS